MKKIEAKVSKLLDDVGQRPEHVLTRIFNKFQESMESSAEKMVNFQLLFKFLFRERKLRSWESIA